MNTLRFSAADIQKGNLILVNPSHPLKREMPESAMRFAPRRHTYSFGTASRKNAVGGHGFFGMYARDCSGQRLPDHAGTARNLCKFPTGAWRGFYKNTSPSGCSEHQTGLAIDLAENRDVIDYIRPDFPYTGMCGRFRELSVRYGFIERYPASCEQITRIAHEPWHFRYVGYPHSEAMREKAFTLEEYTDYLKQFPYQENHLLFKSHWRDFEIFYVPVQENKDALIEIPEGIPYQVSGNNEDGVVLTLWRERL